MTRAAGTATAKVTKWGNSQGVRLPKDILEQAHVSEGDELAILVIDGHISLERVAPTMTLDSLLAGVTRENRHELHEWGKPVGKEKW